ncbi:hypothetical protein B0A54_00138 [Friedmanniomyces endolithicus]|uniref:Uncharacterized protein n=1 Tax=Friedmanniomyces endolithicus TaxID=329885 RepID=A0A4U0VKQ5_9PEZI|nr:hypothetical protein B0A54_00138 [Friedmanniomyces endolithicus]
MSAYDLITSILPTFFYTQLFITPSAPSTSCAGKTVIVTGANTGLGKEAARKFVQLGAEKVILGCRNAGKGEAAKREIEASEGREGVVEVWELDLGDYGSVGRFVERAKGLRRLDVVVENAGINTNKFVEVGGNESTITVNVVSTFLLALLILPKLQETAKLQGTTPNLTIVSSEFPERKDPSIFPALNDPSKARMMDRYNVSKLLEVFACREIARLHPVSDMRVTLNFLSKDPPPTHPPRKPIPSPTPAEHLTNPYCYTDPGLCHSELQRDVPSYLRPLVNTFMLLARTTEVGARTLVHAALAGPETHGKYLSDNRVRGCANLVEGPEGAEVQRRVWGELGGILEGIRPGITKVLDA